MNVDIKVPILGESIVEGTLARWHKKVGEAINAGEIIADLETDKVNIEVSASAAGVITATASPPPPCSSAAAAREEV